MKKMFLSLKIAVAGLLALGMAAAMGLAFAAWLSTGTGSLSVATGTEQSSNLVSPATIGSTASQVVYPGAYGTTTVTYKNTNAYPIVVTSIGGTASNTVNGAAQSAAIPSATSGAAPICNTGDFAVQNVTGTVTGNGNSAEPVATGSAANGIVPNGATTPDVAAGATATYTLNWQAAGNLENTCQAQTATVALAVTASSDGVTQTLPAAK